MNTRMKTRCPNCGSMAQRLLSDRLPTGYKCPDQQVAQTECPVCDYFIAMCWQNGAVLEAYAPGIQGKATAAKPQPTLEIPLLPVSSVMALAPKTLVLRKLLSGQN